MGSNCSLELEPNLLLILQLSVTKFSSGYSRCECCGYMFFLFDKSCDANLIG